MGRIAFTRCTLAALAAAVVACASNGWKWDGTATNDLPNPYRSVSPWGKPAAGIQAPQAMTALAAAV